MGQRPQIVVHSNDSAAQLLLRVSQVVQRPATAVRLFSNGREVLCAGGTSSKTLTDLQVRARA